MKNKFLYFFYTFFIYSNLFAGSPSDIYPSLSQIVDGYIWSTNGWNGTSSTDGTCGVDSHYLDTDNYMVIHYFGVDPSDPSGTSCFVATSIFSNTGVPCSYGNSIYGGTCVPICPTGTFTSKLNICKTCPTGTIYDYNHDSCIDPNSCPPPSSLVNGVCKDLSAFDNDPYGCIKNGGSPTGNLTNPSGNGFWHSGFDLKWKSKCQSPSGAIADTVAVIAGITGNISGTPDKFGSLLGKGIQKVKDAWTNLFNTKGSIPSDYYIALPKYNPASKTYEPEILANPIAPGADGVTPSRAPTLEIDPYNEFLNTTYFPKNNLDSNGYPIVDEATMDRFNTSNEIYKDNGTDPITYTFTPNLQNIWKSTSGSSPSKPLYDSPKMVSDPSHSPKTTIDAPTFRVVPPGSTFYPPVPVVVDHATSSTVVSHTFEGSLPVKQWKTSTDYPDGSKSVEIVDIEEDLKRGDRSFTVESPGGSSSTTSETFNIPNYVPGSTDPRAFDIAKTSPSVNTPHPINTSTSGTAPINAIDPITGYPSPSTPTTPSIDNNIPASQPGQDIINAPMPSYSFPTLGDFTPFEKTSTDGMISDTATLFSNVGSQLTSVKSTFDSTKSLLNGSWTPPTIPPGVCGNTLVLNWHGRAIDLCPPIVDSTSKASPIVSPIVTLGGMGLAISIFLGGF
jgi:hypothetical protein